MNRLILTFDIDWAPDFVVDAVASLQRKHGVPATWFVTHASAAVEKLRREPDLFELGIHPNFLPGSTHGSSPEEVLDHMMSIVPEAVTMRSHGILQWGTLLSEVKRLTPIRIDSTTFLPDMPHIIPVFQQTPHGCLIRVPFFWSDDYEHLRSPPHWTVETFVRPVGLKVLLFHPLRAYLNIPDRHSYAEISSRFRFLADADEDELNGLRRSGAGPGPLLVQTLQMLAEVPDVIPLRGLSD